MFLREISLSDVRLYTFKNGLIEKKLRNRRKLLKRKATKNIRSKNPFKNRSSHTDRVRPNRRY